MQGSAVFALEEAAHAYTLCRHVSTCGRLAIASDLAHWTDCLIFITYVYYRRTGLLPACALDCILARTCALNYSDIHTYMHVMMPNRLPNDHHLPSLKATAGPDPTSDAPSAVLNQHLAPSPYSSSSFPRHGKQGETFRKQQTRLFFLPSPWSPVPSSDFQLLPESPSPDSQHVCCALQIAVNLNQMLILSQPNPTSSAHHHHHHRTWIRNHGVCTGPGTRNLEL